MKKILLPMSLACVALALAWSGLKAVTMEKGETSMSNDELAKKIIAMEKAALDRWGKGDPWGFTEISADEVTYFDTGTERRVDGLKALRDLYAPREGKIKIERYAMINPKVQVHGDTAVLTFNLIDYMPTSKETIREVYWNSTEVYSRLDGDWKIIHTHWSKPKQED